MQICTDKYNASTDLTQQKFDDVLDRLAIVDTAIVADFFKLNPELLPCLWPNRLDDKKKSVRQAVPTGGFDPRCQKLTPIGLGQILRKSIENKAELAVNPADTLWATIDGMKSDTSDHHGIANITGLCIRPLNNAIVTLDFDLPVASLNTDLKGWIARVSPGALLVRGNRARLTMIFRQSDELTEHFKTAENFRGFQKAAWNGTDGSVEVMFAEGCPNNIWGLHKSGADYETSFPKTLQALPLEAFTTLDALLTAAGYVQKNRGIGGTRTTFEDLLADDEFAEFIDSAIVEAATIARPVDLMRLVSKDAAGILHDASKGVKIAKGKRENTIWRLYSDVAAVIEGCSTLGIPLNTGTSEALLEAFAKSIDNSDREWPRTEIDAQRERETGRWGWSTAAVAIGEITRWLEIALPHTAAVTSPVIEVIGSEDVFIESLRFVGPKGGLTLQADSRLATLFAERFGETLTYRADTNTFWEYRVGYWHEITSQTQIGRIIRDELEKTGVGFGAKKVFGVVEILKMIYPQDWKTAPKHLIPLRNGVLNLATMTIEAHKPGDHFDWQLPFDYDVTATCEPFTEWLRETQYDDAPSVKFLQAYVKACITGTPLQVFAEFISKVGGSGKSTLANVIQAMLGAKNVAVTTSQRLNSQFETANFRGKKLIYLSDASKHASDETVDMIKRLTGGDSLPFERKGIQAGEMFVYTGQLMITANQPINSSDSGLERRRRTVQFLNEIPTAKQRDLMNFDPMGGVHTGEFATMLPGIFNWAMGISDADMRLFIKDSAGQVPKMAENFTKIQQATNPLAAWVVDCCVIDPALTTIIGASSSKRVSEWINGVSESSDVEQNTDVHLYPNYVRFCKGNNFKPLSTHKFADELCHLLRCKVKKHRSTVGRSIIGIGLI